MKRKISPFVATNKDWIIRNAIAGYLKSMNMFYNFHREWNANRNLNFEELKKLTELLQAVKDELHLIFTRLIDPKTRTFEKAKKIVPCENELLLINNVGLLFHKAMVVRELKYVMEHYEEESDEYRETFVYFELYINKIQELFYKGMIYLRKVIAIHSENTQMLAFLVENDRYVEDAFNESIVDILKHILDNGNADIAYSMVGKYYVESGWKDRAKKWLQEAVRLNPDNVEAKELYKKLCIKQSSSSFAK